jgi:hypothetical protein
MSLMSLMMRSKNNRICYFEKYIYHITITIVISKNIIKKAYDLSATFVDLRPYALNLFSF